MKLNDTNVIVNYSKRCCFNAFVEHFSPKPIVEDEGQEQPEIEENNDAQNPEVNVGDSFVCPVCGDIILLNEEKEWRSFPASEVVDLSDPAPVVAVEEPLTIPVSVV